MAGPHDTGPHDAWRVRVTGDDVHQAWNAWWAARRAGAAPERVDELLDDLLRLARARMAQASGSHDGRPSAGGA